MNQFVIVVVILSAHSASCLFCALITIAIRWFLNLGCCRICAPPLFFHPHRQISKKRCDYAVWCRSHVSLYRCLSSTRFLSRFLYSRSLSFPPSMLVSEHVSVCVLSIPACICNMFWDWRAIQVVIIIPSRWTTFTCRMSNIFIIPGNLKRFYATASEYHRGVHQRLW